MKNNKKILKAVINKKFKMMTKIKKIKIAQMMKNQIKIPKNQIKMKKILIKRKLKIFQKNH